MIVSVHIPKTGGLSFKTLLMAHFGDRLLLDYHDHPMNKNGAVRNIIAILLMFNTKNIAQKYDCVHGHFLPVKYRLLRKKSFVIWLRDPASRLASRYYHWKRKINQDGSTKVGFIKNINISFEEFCTFKRHQNLYAKYLWGVKLDRFDFVGITENYENSIEVFRRMFEIDNSVQIKNKNINPDKKTGSYSLSAELRDYICKTNFLDYAIYRKALALNSQLEMKFL
jgi:hypothetical protein